MTKHQNFKIETGQEAPSPPRRGKSVRIGAIIAGTAIVATGAALALRSGNDSKSDSKSNAPSIESMLKDQKTIAKELARANRMPELDAESVSRFAGVKTKVIVRDITKKTATEPEGEIIYEVHGKGLLLPEKLVTGVDGSATSQRLGINERYLTKEQRAYEPTGYGFYYDSSDAEGEVPVMIYFSDPYAMTLLDNQQVSISTEDDKHFGTFSYDIKNTNGAVYHDGSLDLAIQLMEADPEGTRRIEDAQHLYLHDRTARP